MGQGREDDSIFSPRTQDPSPLDAKEADLGYTEAFR